MLNRFYSLPAIILEIAKCEVMCKNCHAKHHQGNDWRTQYLKEAQ